jgi:hypothetical protein
MMKPAIRFATFGLVAALITVRWRLDPRVIVLLAGPLFGLALVFGARTGRPATNVRWWKFVALAVLYSTAHTLLVPAAWRFVDPQINLGYTLVDLGPTLGFAAAEICVLLGTGPILGLRSTPRTRMLILASAAALLLGQLAAVAFQVSVNLYRVASYQQLTPSLVVSFVILCSYAGLLLNGDVVLTGGRNEPTPDRA